VAGFLIAILLSPVPSVASPGQYSAGPTWGQVVDADTGEPIAGVLVIALWDLEGGVERSRVGTFKVLEATTDGQGRFRMPGWGPLPASSRGQLDAYDPSLTLFKSGYTPEWIENGPFGERGKRLQLEVHDWASNGGILKLQKYSKAPGDYSRRVNLIVMHLFDVLYGSGCRWKEIPRTVRALEDEEKAERAQGLHPRFSLSAESLIHSRDCGPIDEFMKAYAGTN